MSNHDATTKIAFFFGFVALGCGVASVALLYFGVIDWGIGFAIGGLMALAAARGFWPDRHGGW